MSSEIAICNMALSRLGEQRITSLILPSGEDQLLARRVGLCNDLYYPARDAQLEENVWTFANAQARLAQVSSGPEFGYSMAFMLPPDCLNVWWAGQSETQPLAEWERVGNTIYANPSRSATFLLIWYTRKVVDTNWFSSGFTVALAVRLAAEMAYPLTNSSSREQQLWAEYERKLITALGAEGQQGRTRRTFTTALTKVRGTGRFAFFQSGAPGG